jgi:diguanylate cyclase
VRGCLFEGQAIRVKFSVGLAACRPGDGVEDLIARADRALYQVKQAGKSGMEVA